MKILICGDLHFKRFSSIIRGRGDSYSKRIENCLNTLNWVEQMAEDNFCDEIIYLGDFFDSAELNAEEVTALKEVQWFAGKHKVLVGNHELGNSSLEYSTAHLLQLLPNFDIIDRVKLDIGFGYEILYLPYIMEKNRATISHYIHNEMVGYFTTQEYRRRLILSHNDIKGVNYGLFESKEGFEISDIESNCSLFINGHIHNGQNITDKIINIGNITGQNFNEDATKYKHECLIFDTQTFEITNLENPYAYNFYKMEINSQKEFDKLDLFIFKSHSILSIKCIESLVPQLKEKLSQNRNIDEFRVVTIIESKEVPEEEIQQLNTKDHLVQFQNYILENVGNSEYIVKELQEVLK